MSSERIRTGWSSTTAIHAIPATATIVIVTETGRTAAGKILCAWPMMGYIAVASPATVITTMMDVELMPCVQLTTACLVVSAKTTTADAIGTIHAVMIIDALRTIRPRLVRAKVTTVIAIGTILTAAVIVTGTVPLATVSATGS